MFAFAALVVALQTTPAPKPTYDPCDRDAALVHSERPHLPAAKYKTLGNGRTALVSVTIDETGRVLAATIAQTTGDPELDAAAVESAKASTFSAGRQNCKAIGGTFGITIDFQPNDYDCNHDAYVVKQAAPPDPAPGAFWDMARGAGKTAIVSVTIGADGALQRAVILVSAGSLAFDKAAIQAAVMSKYSPRVTNCRPVVGTYSFKVTFVQTP